MRVYDEGYEIGRMRYDVESRGGMFPVPACPYRSFQNRSFWQDGMSAGYKDAKAAALDTMTPTVKRQIENLRDWNRAKAVEFSKKAAEFQQSANHYEELLKP